MAQEGHAHGEHVEAPAANTVRQCDTIDRRGRGGCTVEEFLLSRLDRFGVRDAMAALDSLAQEDQEIRRDAHAYAHAIGLAAFTTPEEVGEVFATCTPAYQSGCYHGVIQSYFVDHAAAHGDHLDEATVDGLCEAQRGDQDDQWLLFQCAHGMGHGLLMLSGHHLPSALELCDLVSDPWERESCYGGAFMENIVHVTMPHHGTGRPPAAPTSSQEHGDHAAMAQTVAERSDFPPLKKEDPFYPCTVLEDRYLPACYQMQTSAVLYFNGQNLEATARLCGTVPEAVRPTCFQSLGRDISSITLQDHQRAMRLCAIAPDDYEPWCHIGYAKNLVDVTADADDGFEYCRLLPAGESKRTCYVAIGEQIWVLTDSNERRIEMCRSAEDGFVAACRIGAGVAEEQALRPRHPFLRAGV